MQDLHVCNLAGGVALAKLLQERVAQVLQQVGSQ